MNRFSSVVSPACLLTLVLAGPLAWSEEPAKKADPAASEKAIKETVATYLDNISQGKPDGNLKLFVREDVTVVGIPGGAGVEKIWQKKASEDIKYWQDHGPVKHILESTQVELVDDALAVARVKYRTYAVKCRAVFSLTSEGGNWRIASIVVETRLP